MFTLSPHPELHPVFESMGYGIGYLVYKRARRKAGDVLNEKQRWEVIASSAVGALLGSRILGLLEQAPRMHIGWSQLLLPGGGKTIVGGLLGGWFAVELVKRMQGIKSRTGDLFAVPLCIGIGIGRIGCLLAGLADDTYGKPTQRSWAVNFGDGIPRHPTQAYEILFLVALAFALEWMKRRPHVNGAVFRAFLTAYLSWRFLIDFLKPQPLVAGINLIQWACVCGLGALGADFVYTRFVANKGVHQRGFHEAV